MPKVAFVLDKLNMSAHLSSFGIHKVGVCHLCHLQAPLWHTCSDHASQIWTSLSLVQNSAAEVTFIK